MHVTDMQRRTHLYVTRTVVQHLGSCVNTIFFFLYWAEWKVILHLKIQLLSEPCKFAKLKLKLREFRHAHENLGMRWFYQAGNNIRGTSLHLVILLLALSGKQVCENEKKWEESWTAFFFFIIYCARANTERGSLWGHKVLIFPDTLAARSDHKSIFNIKKGQAGASVVEGKGSQLLFLLSVRVFSFLPRGIA